MSRLPQSSLKRKATDAGLGELQAKVPALASSSSAPIRATRSAKPAAANKALGHGRPPALTVPRGPLVQKTNNSVNVAKRVPAKRTVSGPPTKQASSTSRSGPQRPVTGRKPTTKPAVKPTTKPEPVKGKSLQSNSPWDKVQEQLSGIQAAQRQDSDSLRAEMAAERIKREDLERYQLKLDAELALARTQEQEQRRNAQELDAVRTKFAAREAELEGDLRRIERENRQFKDDLRVYEDDLRRERESVRTLTETVSQQSTAHLSLTAQITALKSTSGATATQLEAAHQHAADLRRQIEEAQAVIAEQRIEILESEGLRRKLHNQVQELKGNIRVFCRVRPALPSDGDPTPAEIAYPDAKREKREVVLNSSSENAMGSERRETWQFAFDRVFVPGASQHEVFEEIGLLAQSCVDGYNVCIFAYGQTGSGKSYTMEGGRTPDAVGMIPRAIAHVFEAAEHLKAKGWEYTLEGQFVEIYNETINDLLGSGEFDKKKHEIKHDKGSTRVTDIVVVPLASPREVSSLLARAQSRRSVAATLMNERSSRSHSVFTLRISGSNATTGERCDGALNLVDLAGSERLNASGAGADKDRLRETQSINRSLSALGDVIAALGQAAPGQHIPYRNSKLTYLLQNSLSGNSKTLMMLNLSPLAAHLNESLCSLRFATKVNNTTLGTAKRQIKS